MRTSRFFSPESLATVNLINCFLGYGLAVGLFGWLSESQWGSWTVSVPYRAVSLLLSAAVIWQNRGCRSKVSVGILCLLAYLAILIVRLFIDLGGKDWELTAEDIRIILLLCGSNLFALLSVVVSFNRLQLPEFNFWCFMTAMAACAAIICMNFGAIMDPAVSRFGVNGLYPITVGHLGGALLLLSAIILLTDSGERKMKYLAVAGLVIGLFLIIRAASRGPFLVASLLLTVLVWKKYGWPGALACIVAGVLIATTDLWFTNTGGGLSGRVLKTIVSGDNPRIQIWHDAGSYIAGHLFFGGQFCWYGDAGYCYAHNLVLDAMIAGGIIGLLCIGIPLVYDAVSFPNLFREEAMIPLLILSAQSILESMVSGAFYSNLTIGVAMASIILLASRRKNDIVN